MLFDIYEKLQYTIGDKTLTLADIFKSISFKNVETSNAFYDYYVQDGESPELVSLKIYGTTSYSWVVLLVNNILNIKDWFVSSAEFERTRELNYGGNAYYIAALPDLEPGDILIKVTSVDGNFVTGVSAGAYQNVASYDKFLRKIRGICGAGAIEAGDNVLFARKLDNGNIIPLEFLDQKGDTAAPTNYTNVLYKEQYGNSLDYFYVSQNIVLNPYKKGITGSSIPTYTTYTSPGSTADDDNFALTVLYKYGVCGGVPLEGVYKQQINIGVYEDYLKKQKIRILRPEYLPSVVKIIREAIKSNEIGNTFKIEV